VLNDAGFAVGEITGYAFMSRSLYGLLGRAAAGVAEERGSEFKLLSHLATHLLFVCGKRDRAIARRA
jgi:uncharacterized membrane protein (DUF4010 family)